jgi:hypothetical protein
VTCIGQAFDAIEPGCCRPSSMADYPQTRAATRSRRGKRLQRRGRHAVLGCRQRTGVLLRWRSHACVTPMVCGLPPWHFRDGTGGHSHIRHIRILVARCVYPLDMRMRNYGRVGAAGGRRGLGRCRATGAPRCSRACRARHGCMRPDPTHGVRGSHRFAAKRESLGDRGHQASTLRHRTARVLPCVRVRHPLRSIRSL